LGLESRDLASGLASLVIPRGNISYGKKSRKSNWIINLIVLSGNRGPTKVLIGRIIFRCCYFEVMDSKVKQGS